MVYVVKLHDPDLVSEELPGADEDQQPLSAREQDVQPTQSLRKPMPAPGALSLLRTRLTAITSAWLPWNESTVWKPSVPGLLLKLGLSSKSAGSRTPRSHRLSRPTCWLYGDNTASSPLGPLSGPSASRKFRKATASASLV